MCPPRGIFPHSWRAAGPIVLILGYLIVLSPIMPLTSSRPSLLLAIISLIVLSPVMPLPSSYSSILLAFAFQIGLSPIRSLILLAISCLMVLSHHVSDFLSSFNITDYHLSDNSVSVMSLTSSHPLILLAISSLMLLSPFRPWLLLIRQYCWPTALWCFCLLSGPDFL